MVVRAELFETKVAKSSELILDLSIDPDNSEAIEHLAPDRFVVSCDTGDTKGVAFFIEPRTLEVILFENEEDEGRSIYVEKGQSLAFSGEQTLLVSSRIYPREVKLFHEKEHEEADVDTSVPA